MKLLRFLKNFYAIYMSIVFLLVIFAAPFVGFQFKRNFACDNIIFFVIFLVLLAGSFFLLYQLKNRFSNVWKFIHSNKGFNWIFGIGSAVLILGQFALCSGAWFIAGWDTRNVIFPDMQMNSDYMSMYPNQIFVAGLFRKIYFLTTDGGASFDSYYFTLVLISALCVACSVVFITLVAKKIFSPFIAILVFLCSALFVGYSPWIMVPYSDNLAMFCVSLILFLFVYMKPYPVKWLPIVFVSVIGYYIKPTALFVFLSIVFVLICVNFKNLKSIKSLLSWKTAKSVIIVCFSAALGFVFSMMLVANICNYGVEINKNNSFSATHFLMMGINLETRGAWNNDDVNISRSYSNVEAREAANLKEWSYRCGVYGIPGVSWIFFNKTLTNYADGTFTWESETPWMVDDKGDNPIVRAIYGIDTAEKHNDNNNAMAYTRQLMWFLILSGCALTFFRKKLSMSEYVVICSLLAISAFLTLFEPDARYMILYLPFMTLLAPKGWQTLYRKVSPGIDKFFLHKFNTLSMIVKGTNGQQQE